MKGLFNNVRVWVRGAILAGLGTVAIHSLEAQVIASFESTSDLEKYSSSGGSRLSLSGDRYKFGSHALHWEWTGQSTISTEDFLILSHDESPLKYGDHFPASPTFCFSIYNEKAQETPLKFTFSKGVQSEVWFSINLDFTGWRTLWVPFHEMEGQAPQRGEEIAYDGLTMSVDETTSSGSIYFDDIIYSQFIDDRHAYPDQLVPFIKRDKEPGADHWMPLIRDINRINHVELVPLEPNTLAELAKIESRMSSYTALAPRYKIYMDRLESDFDKLELKEIDGRVVGPPLTFSHSEFSYGKNEVNNGKHNDIMDFGKTMKSLGTYYDRADAGQRTKIEEMFVLGTKYYLDQGWQEGASGGTRHHIGYNTRELALGFFVMREALEDNGLINEVGASLMWLFNLGKILGDESEFHANIDYLNTQAFYHLMLIFLTDDKAKQQALLLAYSNYMSIVLAQDDEKGVFKVDGTGWHHNGHYPAYALGAYRNVPSIIQALSSTSFSISPEGHANFRKAFMATRLYSHGYDIGFGNAGRHPLGTDIRSLREAYLQMTNAGAPGSTSGIDKEVAAAYLSLWGEEDPISARVFAALNGVEKEELSGYYTFPYAATAVQKKNNWAAIIKGYSKYVWASEIYVTDNRYGRYPANGTIQLYNEGGNEGSGFAHDGWDWNRYPGATVINLPFEELEPEAALIMYRSGETFAGAVEQDGNGVFGMILSETKGSNADGPEVNIGYPGHLKAKKSVFSFGDKLICIGTDISSIDAEHPTQTNLFQVALPDQKMKILSSETDLGSFPETHQLEESKQAWVIDPYGNGYHLLSARKVHLQKKHQQSYHNKYSVRTGKASGKTKGQNETEGDFATAWIDHGLAPKGASYQYVIYPSLPEDQWKKFGGALKKEKSYEVLQANGQAHIVRDKNNRTTGYVIYEASENLTHGPLTATTDPLLMMIKEAKGQLLIQVVQPDLNFEGHGNKYENMSRPVTTTFSVSGVWKKANDSDDVQVKVEGSFTHVTVTCVHGLATKVRLVR
ncbi:chondroitinase family polysaccharide lyase [Reichenbachiella carrageenanivorans]|uniref:Chondroitinase family polysaccharide lyase n=1 Tax=Reichenbachiella carrageenanivorans TaxID=2979869 RepID=A0ABY6D559_9BACT|nr:chondroitinase family polysaccharide lyase [Reichenbachiella carrageenanivorans]UXX81299.1 chondroitinase family polysaccharide lyase [Reichenbachiella carrageenanivorans]